MIALTIRQPYASRIIAGWKTIENRSRPTSVRGLVLVHAGGAIHERFRLTEHDSYLVRDVGELPRSAVLGVVQLVGSHPSTACPDREACQRAGGERPGPGQDRVFHWELADARAFPTEIPRVKGALGFWHPTDVVEHQAAAAMAGEH